MTSDSEASKIILGDCLEVMDKLPDNHFDLVLTDPPYGIDYQSSRKIARLRTEKIVNDTRPYVEWMEAAYRVLKPTGSMLCFYRWDVAQAFIDEAKRVGFNVKSEIVWDKGVHGMGDLKAAYAPQHETIMFCTKSNFKFPGKRPTSVIRTMRVDPGIQLHPNEKPVDLLKRLISHTTSEGDIVLDCFSGSGATARACKDIGRECVGIEIDPRYVKIAEQRLKQEVLL